MLSIIIPTYGRTDSLARLLKILLVQTIADKMEVLLIDQNEAGFLEKEITLSRFLNVKCIRSEHPNVALARNIGALHSEYSYLLFLDDDLVPGQNFCESGADFFAMNTFIECFTPWIKSDIAQVDAINPIKNNIVKKINDQLFEITDTISAAVFITKKAFLKSGGFDAGLFEFARTAEDQEFFLRFKFKGIQLYYTTSFSIFHDETKTGGCDLRTVNYWITREKCIRSWIYRYKIHRGGNLRLHLSDYINLSRSIFLNKAVLTSGMSSIIKQIQLFNKALAETNGYLNLHKAAYTNPVGLTHLKTAGQNL